MGLKNDARNVRKNVINQKGNPIPNVVPLLWKDNQHNHSSATKINSL